MNYLLIDTANLFFRARHVVHQKSTISEKVGLTLHIIFSSISKSWRDHNSDHVVFCLDGHSWRKNEYIPYKKNRTAQKALMSKKEQEEDIKFWEAYNSLIEYLDTRTNCSVILEPQAEADDVIARFIALHPKDKHTIVSSDSDLLQLISKNVNLYNGITKELYTTKGVFDDKGNPVIDRKTKQPKSVVDPEWLIFEKCIRGDSSDNIFSAYPGAMLKSTKNRIGIKEAFADKNKKGYNWNNFMLQRWVDHNKKEHKVLEDYERNRKLIDLTMQPDEIKKAVDQKIHEATAKKDTKQIGTYFIKFCGKFELVNLLNFTQSYVAFLNAPYLEDKNV